MYWKEVSIRTGERDIMGRTNCEEKCNARHRCRFTSNAQEDGDEHHGSANHACPPHESDTSAHAIEHEAWESRAYHQTHIDTVEMSCE